jgi:hypothetical protein
LFSRHYVGNGITREFPLPEGADGENVYLLLDGLIIPMNKESYAIQNGAAVFSIPPPNGSIVAFEPPAGNADAGAAPYCYVIYPDGTMKKVSQDPYELLIEAKAERDEAKKLLRQAAETLEKTERVVHVESEIAKEKLTARLEKYSTLVEDSIKGVGDAAKTEVENSLDKKMIEFRNKHKSIQNIHARAEAILTEAREAATQAAALAAQEVEEKCRRAIEAADEMRALKIELQTLRDEAGNAAASSGANAAREAGAYTQAVIEEIRSLKAIVEGEVRAVVEKARAESVSLNSEIRAGLDDARRLASQAALSEKRCGDALTAMSNLEAGMKELWARMRTRRTREGDEQ